MLRCLRSRADASFARLALQILEKRDDLSILCKAVKAADLDDTLDDPKCAPVWHCGALVLNSVLIPCCQGCADGVCAH